MTIRKKNEESPLFPLSSFEAASESNPDRFGYVIFSPEGKTSWKVKEKRLFDLKPRKETGFTYHQNYVTVAEYMRVGDKRKKKDKERAKWEEAIGMVFDKQFELEVGEMMIVHFRLSTSGHSHFNTQPIETDDLIVVHNGIFPVEVDIQLGWSDTRAFADKLEKRLRRTGKRDQSKEFQAIKKFLKEVGGWYSVFIYSKKTGGLYYFKSEQASFNLAFNGVLGSTKSIRFPEQSIKAKNGLILNP